VQLAIVTRDTFEAAAAELTRLVLGPDEALASPLSA
jgi:hypothetical protein